MSFPPYSTYKDSRVEWQGLVPIDWPRSALKYLADYQNGYPFKPEEWSPEGLPIIRISQLTGDTESNYYSGVLDDRVRVIDGDLLFSWSATIDSFIWAGGDAWLNQHIFKVSVTEEADQQFLFYLIKLVAPKLAEFDAHGSTMRHIKKESLSERLHVPALAEQTQIARFLDYETARIVALIEEQQRLIELLKEKHQTVISHTVTKGLDPTAPMKDSGVGWLGEVPEHWEVKPLRYLGECQNGINIGGEAFGSGSPFVSYGDVHKNPILPSKATGLVQSSLEDQKRYSVKIGDVFFTRTSETIDEIGFSSTCLRDIPHAVFAGFLIRFRPTEKSVLPNFSQYYFRNQRLRAFFNKEMNLVTRASLSQDLLKMLPVALPPGKEQLEIANFLDEASAKFSSLLEEGQRSIALLTERRSALISAAVTGKIDVRDWQPLEGEATFDSEGRQSAQGTTV